jgi:hypothetical protein
MITGGRSLSTPVHAPITDVSLLALLDDAAISIVAGALRNAVPDLEASLHRLACAEVGPHVTLYEFIHVPGHAALPTALRWCARFGAELVERVARLGQATFAGVSIKRSPDAAVVVLDARSPASWLRRVVALCSAIEPEPLHLTIARKPVPTWGRQASSVEPPVDLVFSVHQFALAVARQLPYRSVHCVHSRGAASDERRDGRSHSVPRGVALLPKR